MSDGPVVPFSSSLSNELKFMHFSLKDLSLRTGLSDLKISATSGPGITTIRCGSILLILWETLTHELTFPTNYKIRSLSCIPTYQSTNLHSHESLKIDFVQKLAPTNLFYSTVCHLNIKNLLE